MAIYTFEIKNTFGCCDDFGSTHMNIVANSEKEAWAKALKLEDRKNIIRIWNIKYI